MAKQVNDKLDPQVDYEHSIKMNRKPLNEIAAKWQTTERRDQITQEVLEEVILKRIQQATDLIKESSLRSGDQTGDEKTHFEEMEWDSLYELSANIMDEYTRHVDQILSSLDKIYQKQYLWQESAFIMDSHKGAAVIRDAERWMKEKEQYLSHNLKEFEQSAGVIKKTIKRLTKEE